MKEYITEDERELRIVLVGKYIAKTGASTRQTAEHFSNNYFEISNFTVSEYCKKYMKKNKEDSESLKNIIQNNKPISIDNEEIKNRVLLVAKYVKEGFLLEEIAEQLKISFWEAYRDIHNRLKSIDENLYSEVCEILSNRSRENLKK